MKFVTLFYFAQVHFHLSPFPEWNVKCNDRMSWVEGSPHLSVWKMVLATSTKVFFNFFTRLNSSRFESNLLVRCNEPTVYLRFVSRILILFWISKKMVTTDQQSLQAWHKLLTQWTNCHKTNIWTRIPKLKSDYKQWLISTLKMSFVTTANL